MLDNEPAITKTDHMVKKFLTDNRKKLNINNSTIETTIEIVLSATSPRINLLLIVARENLMAKNETVCNKKTKNRAERSNLGLFLLLIIF